MADLITIPDLLHRIPPSQLPELMDGPSTHADLRACLRDLAWVNRVLLGYRPILTWLNQNLPHLKKLASPLRILDIGSGYGDTLRRIESWAAHHQLSVRLTGLDLNPETIAIAAQTSPGSRIEWVTADLFAYTPPEPPHLIVSSLMAHHLEDPDVVRLLKWLDANAAIGWLINDLSRHPTPARLFALFARVTRLHPFVQHDGPVSFARAFRREDWQRLCAAAGLDPAQVDIRPFTPGRLCVSRIKRP